MIIDNQSHYNSLKEKIFYTDIILIPVYSDINYHVCNNKILAIYIYLINDNSDYMLLYNHNETLFETYEIFDILKEHIKNIFVFDKKNILHNFKFSNLIDLTLLEYFDTNKKISLSNTLTNAHKFIYNKYFNYTGINNIVPAIKHLEYCRNNKNHALTILNKEKNLLANSTFQIYNDIVLTNYYNIEKSGIAVNIDLLKKYFPDKYKYHIIDKDIVYSNYNIYTSTGRPANSFANINFAALTKDDGCRSMIISRFKDNGKLIEFDFDGYHIRLIADIIGYKFPDNCSVHEYLGKQYFGKDTLTEKDYNESKSISFQLIYGGIYKEFEQIPYFKLLKDYIYNIWNKFKKDKYIESILFKRQIKNIDNINQYKLWNYIIQLHETEQNNVILYKLFKTLNEFQSKIILYTYDSFLFDIDKNEETEFINKIKPIIECNGKFPVKIKCGKDYNKMN